MLTQKEITSLLGKLTTFEQLPSPTPAVLTEEQNRLVGIAKKYTARQFVVTMETDLETSRVDRSSFNELTVRVAVNLITGLGVTPRTQQQIIKSLAHELGYVIGGRTYEQHGFSFCEKEANQWQQKLLGELYNG